MLTPDFDETAQESVRISSTPLTHLPTRKRKHDETLESCPTSPKFSSTCNESLITNFNQFRLEGSVPSTPEKQLKLVAKTVVPSPAEETRKILYNKIKVVKPERKFGVKVKYGNCNIQSLLHLILNNNVIMGKILKNLSGGDLYRFSLVSASFLKALEENNEAYNRYKIYKTIYRDNKENYVITPPGSPEKCDSPPRTDSEVFNKFRRYAKNLTRSQSLTKCRKCESVAIVDNDISQCQNVYSCGLIYCLLCSSYSETGPKDFNDQCGHAFLRPKLGNVSNCMEESFYSINFSSQDSGFYSENESPSRVKRNLFSTPRESSPKVLSICNYNKITVSQKKKEQVSYVPVIANKEQVRRQVICDSPPRYGYAVGSKQSKRNLKRLTR
ncbi:hypothetical protein BDFB_002862 [Asbolus verrucosus]|uniref:Uncharacterized protein n=1 Tax=Asbolus verrucosus TaxID=1661398 RepID=A0A482VNC6_ASBVE|nr:hypothetical protein BDFB_002862 [Asbolus verrucosus]